MFLRILCFKFLIVLMGPHHQEVPGAVGDLEKIRHIDLNPRSVAQHAYNGTTTVCVCTF